MKYFNVFLMGWVVVQTHWLYLQDELNKIPLGYMKQETTKILPNSDYSCGQHFTIIYYKPGDR